MPTFNALKYYCIVTFDFGCPLTEQQKRKLLIKKLEDYYPSSNVKEEDYDNRIYDCEFSRFNKETKPIVVENIELEEIHRSIKEFNESQEDEKPILINLEEYCPDNLSYYIIFDSYCMGTTNICFETKHIDIERSIQLLKEFGGFVDKWLFSKIIFPDICSCLNSVFNNRSPILLEHHTYHALVTNDGVKDKPTEKEIYGLVWKDKQYNRANKERIKVIVENIAIDLNDKLIISQPATFMSFRDVTFEGNYVKSNVRSIEILRRLHHLLKKYDYQLSEITGRKSYSNIPATIKEIIRIQSQTIEFVEYFLQPKAFATELFANIMDKGSRVFKMIDLYENVKNKLDITYNTLNDLIQDRRNKILYYLQIIGLFFASITFTISILHPLLLRIYSSIGPYKIIENMIGTFWIPLGDFICSALLTLLGYLLIRNRINK